MQACPVPDVVFPPLLRPSRPHDPNDPRGHGIEEDGEGRLQHIAVIVNLIGARTTDLGVGAGWGRTAFPVIYPQNAVFFAVLRENCYGGQFNVFCEAG